MAIYGVFTFILILVLPVALVSLIISAAVSKDKGEYTKFKNGVKISYTYIIVIVTLLMIIISSISAVSSVANYLLPESEITSNNTYDVRIEKNESIRNIAISASVLIVAIPLFIINSKKTIEFNKIKSDNKKAQVKTK